MGVGVHGEDPIRYQLLLDYQSLIKLTHGRGVLVTLSYRSFSLVLSLWDASRFIALIMRSDFAIALVTAREVAVLR